MWIKNVSDYLTKQSKNKKKHVGICYRFKYEKCVPAYVDLNDVIFKLSDNNGGHRIQSTSTCAIFSITLERKQRHDFLPTDLIAKLFLPRRVYCNITDRDATILSDSLVRKIMRPYTGSIPETIKKKIRLFKRVDVNTKI